MIWITADDVIAIHSRVIEKSGGKAKQILQKDNNKTDFAHRLEIPVNLVDNLIFLALI